MHSRFAAFTTVTFVTSLLLSAELASASDYSHTCRSADGNYEMNDDSLSRSDSDASSGQEISYTTLKETILKRETGYCITKTGKRYDFEFKSYTRRIKFSDGADSIEIDMVCEMASDGLPANEVCQKNVSTSKSGDQSNGGGSDVDKPAPGTQGWMHNGSEMKLVASGKRRRFVYVSPRSALKSVGVKRGDTVFEGSRDSNDYSGTAYIFKKGCDPQGYPVAGSVSSDERNITMTGQRPHINDDCRVGRYSDDTLVFELPGSE